MDKMSILKELEQKFHIPLSEIKIALDYSGYDRDQAILYLRNHNKIENISISSLLAKLRIDGEEWALEFIGSLYNKKNVPDYEKMENWEIIKENYFTDSIIGIGGKCPYIKYKNQLELCTDEEVDMFTIEIRNIYEESVSNLIKKRIDASG